MLLQIKISTNKAIIRKLSIKVTVFMIFLSYLFIQQFASFIRSIHLVLSCKNFLVSALSFNLNVNSTKSY